MLHPILPLVLASLLGWGLLGDLFGGSDEVRSPARDALAAQVEARLAHPAQHPALATVYDAPRLVWASASDRAVVADLLAGIASDGVSATDTRADAVPALRRALARAERRWAALDGEARDTLADPRPARLAALDVAMSDALLRAGDALRGRRTDPTRLYTHSWFPVARDSTGALFGSLADAMRAGDPAETARALDGLRPPHDGYRRLRTRLAALSADLAPVPDGATLLPGERSVRVPHVRDRLAAWGYVRPDTLDAWARPDAYVFDDSLAVALGRFRADHGLGPDTVLDAAATDALNTDLAPVRQTIALNLERWRWMADDLGDHFVWVNLPAFELRVVQRDSAAGLGAPYEERLRMPVNIGNAMTAGWTTPIITDSIHTVEFQPAWYVPRSLAASNVFPMAVADSLALWRAGFEVYRNGAAVDSRLVPWDSVSVGEFRFVQRPGPGNPLGRVKFLMHNPYAILIHDTNKRHTFDDGAGSSMSSGCVQAGAPDKLAEYLLTTVNGWEPGQAEAAWRRGPRRGVGLNRPFLSHFTYFTAVAEPDGRLRMLADPYGYDPRLAMALGLDETADDDGPPTG
ncbi:L,D-transpeptidase family protein [Rubrivirga sp. IMCC43871]|uniref:L,D-transpeptidase family protein n=1 Tax=Rubrivirga sp. IMCC43871 TaxID=3391575 RepID=UPI00398FA841